MAQSFRELLGRVAGAGPPVHAQPERAHLLGRRRPDSVAAFPVAVAKAARGRVAVSVQVAAKAAPASSFAHLARRPAWATAPAIFAAEDRARPPADPSAAELIAARIIAAAAARDTPPVAWAPGMKTGNALADQILLAGMRRRGEAP